MQNRIKLSLKFPDSTCKMDYSRHRLLPTSRGNKGEECGWVLGEEMLSYPGKAELTYTLQ